MFSRRVAASLESNAIARTVAALRDRGAPLLDLTGSNPTTAGFEYPPGLLQALAHPAALVYDPRPFGSPLARAAIAGDCARRGVTVDPGRIVLTASSSESYALLFKLTCDPGDRVLAPVPSYPLFEHLAALEGVGLQSYRLEYRTSGPGIEAPGTWGFDPEEVAALVDDRTRAVLVVSPNNPTGSTMGHDELEALLELCADRDLVLVADEVFAGYPLDPRPGLPPSVLGPDAPALVVSLGGLSKSAGLPQLKLGWMALGGPDELVSAALARLELICDTYLSVATPVQAALPDLLRLGGLVHRQIADRVLLNYRALAAAVQAHPASRLLRAEGGWSAVVQSAATEPDDERVVRLAKEAGVLVHPGYFFDFERDGHCVVSLLTPPDDFREGVRRLLLELDC